MVYKVLVKSSNLVGCYQVSTIFGEMVLGSSNSDCGTGWCGFESHGQHDFPEDWKHAFLKSANKQ